MASLINVLSKSQAFSIRNHSKGRPRVSFLRRFSMKLISFKWSSVLGFLPEKHSTLSTEWIVVGAAFFFYKEFNFHIKYFRRIIEMLKRLFRVVELLRKLLYFSTEEKVDNSISHPREVSTEMWCESPMMLHLRLWKYLALLFMRRSFVFLLRKSLSIRFSKKRGMVSVESTFRIICVHWDRSSDFGKYTVIVSHSSFGK